MSQLSCIVFCSPWGLCALTLRASRRRAGENVSFPSFYDDCCFVFPVLYIYVQIIYTIVFTLRAFLVDSEGIQASYIYIKNKIRDERDFYDDGSVNTKWWFRDFHLQGFPRGLGGYPGVVAAVGVRGHDAGGEHVLLRDRSQEGVRGGQGGGGEGGVGGAVQRNVWTDKEYIRFPAPGPLRGTSPGRAGWGRRRRSRRSGPWERLREFINAVSMIYLCIYFQEYINARVGDAKEE